MKKVLALVAASTLLATSAMADEAVMSKFKMSVGGFVKLDYAYNSENLGPSGLISPAQGIGVAPGSAAGMQEQSILGIRQSRLWFKVDGPTLSGAKTGGLIEGDFYGDNGAPTESPMFRVRLAYATIDWKDTSILFGQYWDMFAPMVSSTQDFRSGGPYGAPNSPRIPMIKLTQRVDLNSDNQLAFTLGVQDPNQYGNNQAAASGTSGTNLNYAGQISFTSKALGVAPGYFGLSNKPLTLTLFGIVGNEYLAASAAKSVETWGYGAYLFAPILKSADGKGRAMTLSLEGQAYEAANQNWNGATQGTLVQGMTVAGATAAQITNGQVVPMKDFGATAQLIFYPTQNLGITGGWGARILANKAQDMLTLGGAATSYQKLAQEVYFNVAYDFNAAVRLAAEYQNLQTNNYNTNNAGALAAGVNTLYNVNVGRLCAYYFF